MKMPEHSFTPKEFLKSRRPERFSDSIGHDIPILDRSILEYHLDSLTNRSEELQFETFARRLLERTVCPNLLPHTGPTGGGDSKVDTETYPIAESLAMRWYIGIGNEAATERWGFAFSAKKDWRPKLKSDIAKIAKTERGYTKAFFISNQYIRDKDRAQVEDDLRKEHGLEVRVFDRTWLLDNVFRERLEELAIDELGLQISVRREVQRGPLDTAREQDLANIEARIAAALQDGRRDAGLVDDCLEAAELARSLERSRAEVEGLYARAKRLAMQFGTSHQQIQCVYDRAWTAFWWHEDYSLFIELYESMEERASGSRNAYHFDLWTNLLFLLRGIAVRQSELSTPEIDLQARAKVLTIELDRLGQEVGRPSTVLQARTLRLLVSLVLEHREPGAVDSVFRELSAVIIECESLIGYPLEPLVQLLTELGQFLGSRPAYDDLFEVVVQTASRREGDVSAARMLLARGAQQLDADNPYEAIRTLGRTLGRLYKHESRHELVGALYLCARAYEKVGLLWAARGTMLSAAAIATDEFWTYEQVTPQQAACYRRLKWIELRLGRVPHLLAWHEFDGVIRHVLTQRGYNSEPDSEDERNFDAILGMLLLRTDLWELRELTTMPDVLDRFNLSLASIALAYALGHEDEVPPRPSGKPADPESTYRHFLMWRDQPAAKEIAPTPLLWTRRTVTLSSRVLGCHITVYSSNDSPSVELAESLLAIIESLLATGALVHMIAREPELTIDVRSSDLTEAPFTWKVRDKDGRPHVDVRCPIFDPHSLSISDQVRLKERIFELIIQVVSRVFTALEPEQLLAKLFDHELAPQRALDFTTSFMVVGKVLGTEPRTKLSSWFDRNAKVYPLTRKAVWDQEDRTGSAEVDGGKEPTLADPNVEPPGDLSDLSGTTHNQMQTISLIRESLWNEASWAGVGFVGSPDTNKLVALVLLFNNLSTAAKIFSQWRSELGPRDEFDRLRIAIVRGISREQPHMYRVVIGSSPATYLPQSSIKFINTISRIHTMDPPSSKNLDRLVKSYEPGTRYILTFGSSANQQLTMAHENRLVKQQLFVRDAWQIGPHDIDAVAIRKDDDPIIPDGQSDAPILRTLHLRRN